MKRFERRVDFIGLAETGLKIMVFSFICLIIFVFLYFWTMKNKPEIEYDIIDPDVIERDLVTTQKG